MTGLALTIIASILAYLGLLIGGWPLMAAVWISSGPCIAIGLLWGAFMASGDEAEHG